MTIRPTERSAERPLPGEGEELVRRALEDGVIAHERDPNRRAGWSIADLARDLGISETRAAKMVRPRPGETLVCLRVGQLPLLRPRIRAAALSAIGCSSSEHRTVESHVRHLSARTGRLNELLERAMDDEHVDDTERAQLRAEMRSIAEAASQGARDLGGEP